MATVGFIGAGNIGSTVARLALAADYEVVLSNRRGPESLAGLVAELGRGARAGTTDEVATAGDLVVVTIPFAAYRDVPAEPLHGKVVVDTGNYYPARDGRFEELDAGRTTSSELVQQHLGDARLVKAFNNISSRHLQALARPEADSGRAALPLSGDDAEAKAAVTRLINAIGFDAVDAGPLGDGWRHQPDTPAYAGLYTTDGDWSRPRAASADELRAALASARPPQSPDDGR